MLKHIAGGARPQPARAESDPPPPRLQPPRQPPRRQPPAPAQSAQLDSSKRSLGGTTTSLSPPQPPPVPPPRPGRAATEEALTSLALLCLVSLLLALLSLIFLLKISPGGGDAGVGGALAADELAVVYEVTLALCALTLSLNLCCLLVCAIQFLFAVKLVHSPGPPGGRTNKYLQKSAVTRVCAVAGFFISIPVFLTGIILYTFIQFHSTPAIVTSVFIGLGIVFCGCAMVHNVFIWQKEKTNVVRSLRSHPVINSITTPPLQLNVNGGFMGNGHLPSANTTLGGNISFHSAAGGGHGGYSHPITMLQHQGPYIIRPPTSTPPGEGANGASPGVPEATLNLSHVMSSPDTHELSTLV